MHCFSSCPSVRTNGMWMHTASTNSTMRIWHLGPVTPQPTFLFSAHHRVTKLPGPDTTRSSQGQHRRMERAAGKNDRKRSRKQLTRQDASESVGHAAQVQSSTLPHTTPTKTCSKYRQSGNTEHFGFHAAPFRLCTSAPSVNDFQCFIPA